MEPLHSLVPLVHVRSVKSSIHFYETLGFQVRNTHTPEGGDEPVWAWLQSSGAHLMLGAAGEPVDPASQAVLFYVYSPDLVEYRNRLLEEGAAAGPIQRPFYAPHGEFRVTDPDGYVLMVTHT